jgi:hypothetical protein
MAVFVPPTSPPGVAAGENDRLRRVHLRLFQIMTSAITVFVTAWFCTFGVIPAILAIMTAKHVLVAICMMGLGIHE